MNKFKTEEERKAYYKKYHKEYSVKYRAKRTEKQILETRERDRKNSIKYRKERAIERNSLGTRRETPTTKYVTNLKDTTPCADCKQYFPAVCMDFDHVRGEKTTTVSKLMWSRVAHNIVLEEINKCELVCSNCHRLRTSTRVQHNRDMKMLNLMISKLPQVKC